MLLIVAFSIEYAVRLFWSLCSNYSYFDKIEAVFGRGIPRLLLWHKGLPATARSATDCLWRRERRRRSGSMKRGAVGAVADFLGVVGVGGAGTGEMLVL